MIMASTKQTASTELPNGPGAAALLAAGIGCATLGVFTLLAEASKGINTFFNFYVPTGALSGVSTSAIVVWLVAWFGLHRAWAEREVAIARVSIVAFVLLLIGFALTFPPFIDLLQGK